MSLLQPVFMQIRFKIDYQNQLFATISNKLSCKTILPKKIFNPLVNRLRDSQLLTPISGNLSCKIILPYKILLYCYKKYQSYSLPLLRSFRRTLLYLSLSYPIPTQL